MSKLHREHSIDASYHVSVHLAKRFQRRRVNQDIILMALHVLLVVTVHTSQSMPSLVVNHVMVARIQLTLLQNQRMIAKVS
jgi:hypothetical protein